MRRVFYSFHFKNDNQRVNQVRQMGTVEGNKIATDNEWEEIKADDQKITNWIDEQMSGKSCVIVLIGEETANRKWINHEITKGWNDVKGVVGIRIHGLKNLKGETAYRGDNPFDYIEFLDGSKMSKVVKCYDPLGSNSKEKYDWIKNNLEAIIEEAIDIRDNYHG